METINFIIKQLKIALKLNYNSEGTLEEFEKQIFQKASELPLCSEWSATLFEMNMSDNHETFG